MDFLDPEYLIATFGTIGLFAIVFAESGLFFGFFLPGDSLLLIAGLLASRGDLSLPVILVGCFVAAAAGDQVGYAFGRRVGPALFRRSDSRFFRHEHVERAQSYFERHGSKTIVIARFVPIVRTFAPIVAGVASMPYRTFVTFNVLGGFLWSVGMITAGYVVFEAIPGLDRYVLLVVGAVIALSLLPIAIEMRRARRGRLETPPER